MTLNYIQQWGSTFGDLEIVEYSYTAIIPWYSLTWTGSTCYDSICGSNRYV